MPVIDMVSKTIITHTTDDMDTPVGTIVVMKEPDYITTYRVVDVGADAIWCRYRSQVCIREDRA